MYRLFGSVAFRSNFKQSFGETIIFVVNKNEIDTKIVKMDFSISAACGHNDCGEKIFYHIKCEMNFADSQID